MQNKKTIWRIVGVIIVVLIIVLAVVGMHAGSNSSNTSSSTDQAGTNQQVSSGSTQGSPMSLKDLLSSGASQQCGFSTQNPNAQTVAGTVYVTSGHLRGD